MEQKQAVTELFQAIANYYEKLVKPLGKMMRRVRTPVAAAAELGDLQELLRLLRELPSRANEHDEMGATPLMFAAKGGYILAAMILANYGANIHAKNPLGWSALLWAALNDRDQMISFFVERGATVSEHELILVAFAGHGRSLVEMLKAYPGSVATLRTCTNNQTLLHLACFGMMNLPMDRPGRYLDLVKVLLRRGVPVDAKDKLGRTCLELYVSHQHWLQRQFEKSTSHIDFIELLCEHGAKPYGALSIAESSRLHVVRGTLVRYMSGTPHISKM
jgi:ankyrin repeat protein